jgi:hypothetical protein
MPSRAAIRALRSKYSKLEVKRRVKTLPKYNDPELCLQTVNSLI